MNRQAQGVVLLLLGGALLKATVFSDIYLRYVKESLQPFLIGAGALLVAAGIMAIVNDLRAPSTNDHDHGDDKPHHEPRIGWMLIAPVLGLLLVAPPALGAFAAGQSGSAVLQGSELYAPLPEGDPATISVLDYATRAVFDKGRSMKDAKGGNRKVLISGFLSGGPEGKVLTRMMLSCCAADARPIKVGMSGDAPVGLPDDQWLEVTGVYTTKTAKDPVNGQDIPFIEVIQWKQIAPPRNQYE
ncbi:membrane protein [Rhizocola hellebori]|uniref:Membrane protein n=1 Tax=Rhizocola hellebori TaxID=1392758 RepID=A0A8J3Q3V0_9ACTN|nr:TIGR03943 family protein [Rhizocola hellebori]GIH03181.1 membrane protein [Rhizocola hellebori]